MKVLVYFSRNKDFDDVANIGMNRLFIIEDKRIKKLSTMHRRIVKLCNEYHPAKKGCAYIVRDWQDNEITRNIAY
jgi:hypothetical protein